MKIKKSNTKEDIDILLETIIDLQKQVNELKERLTKVETKRNPFDDYQDWLKKTPWKFPDPPTSYPKPNNPWEEPKYPWNVPPGNDPWPYKKDFQILCESSGIKLGE